MEVEDKIRIIISEHLGKSTEEVGNDRHLMNDLGADSLDLVELVMAFEEEFEIEIHDDVAEQFATMTVANITNAVKGLME